MFLTSTYVLIIVLTSNTITAVVSAGLCYWATRKRVKYPEKEALLGLHTLNCVKSSYMKMLSMKVVNSSDHDDLGSEEEEFSERSKTSLDDSEQSKVAASSSLPWADDVEQSSGSQKVRNPAASRREHEPAFDLRGLTTQLQLLTQAISGLDEKVSELGADMKVIKASLPMIRTMTVGGLQTSVRPLPPGMPPI